MDTFAGYRNTGWLLFSSCPLYVALLSPGLTLLWQEICCYSDLFPYLPLAGGEQPPSTQWGPLERVFRWVESFIFCITFKFLAVMIIHTLPLNVYWFGLLSCYFSRDESRHKSFFPYEKLVSSFWNLVHLGLFTNTILWWCQQERRSER